MQNRTHQALCLQLLLSGQTAVFIGRVARDLAQDLDFRQQLRRFLSLGELGAHDGALLELPSKVSMRRILPPMAENLPMMSS